MCSWKVTLEPRHENTTGKPSSGTAQLHSSVNAMRCLCLTFCLFCLLTPFPAYYVQVQNTVQSILMEYDSHCGSRPRARSWIPVTRASILHCTRSSPPAHSVWWGRPALDTVHATVHGFLFSLSTHYCGQRLLKGPAAILDKMTWSRRSNWGVSLILLDGCLPFAISQENLNSHGEAR